MQHSYISILQYLNTSLGKKYNFLHLSELYIIVESKFKDGRLKVMPEDHQPSHQTRRDFKRNISNPYEIN